MVSRNGLVFLACLALSVSTQGDLVNYLMTTPQNPLLRIGDNFTATCLIKNTTEVTAEDLTWKLANEVLPRDQYTVVNDSALNVTFTITSATPQWLYCFSDKDSLPVRLNKMSYIHATPLRKGYPPVRPENLSCKARQDGTTISPTLRCEWEPKQPQTKDLKTNITLNVNMLGYREYNKTTEENSAEIKFDVFPNFMMLDIWVEAVNELGKVESEHLRKDANSFTQTDPPAQISIVSEKNFHSSLLLNWTRLTDKSAIHLIYEIRFTPKGSHNWSYVPQADTNSDKQSFWLQNLRPYTVYITQVRCKNERDGYWSDWSANSTKRTPEYKPTSKPDVWQIITESEGTGERQLQLFSKEPESANGKIKGFEIKIQDLKEKSENKSAAWETVPVSDPDEDRNSTHITLLKTIHLSDKASLIVNVTAFNSEGKSPATAIIIPEKENGFAPVQELKVYPDGGRLYVEWSPINSRLISEYLVQWDSGRQFGWQREKKNIKKTSIRDNLEKFVRYSVSVYPLYSGWIGKPARVEAYLEQGAPLEGPSVKLNGKPGCNNAQLTWQEIPLNKQQGFITNYTIFYTDGTTTKAITVPSDTFSYTLTSLNRSTRYDTWIRVSNSKGSFNGINHSFTTLKYAPGEIEGIVVGVSLCFLFVVVLTMLICICKRDVIKESLWPQIPNPGESTISNWSPDYPIKTETPTENCLSGISVLDVDVDGKSVFDEDKSCLPLKKDKYLSEEHSSGIGGSSCMSSPRQSVSDSDEGGDMADTTSSTVQYSSVVASSGYKGQTPSLQPQQAVFSRSESTQPLLESEEHPDMLSLEGSRQSQRLSRLSFNQCDPNQLEMEEQKTMDFCAMGEDSPEQMSPAEEQTDDWLGAEPISSYMPQLGGYRPQ